MSFEVADQPLGPEVVGDVAEDDRPVIVPDLDLYLDGVLGEFSHAAILRVTPALAQCSLECPLSRGVPLTPSSALSVKAGQPQTTCRCRRPGWSSGSWSAGDASGGGSLGGPAPGPPGVPQGFVPDDRGGTCFPGYPLLREGAGWSGFRCRADC